jgi:hypothetical protein
VTDNEAIAKTMIERDGRSMTLLESLACAYSVEGHLRTEIAKLQRELAAMRRLAEHGNHVILQVVGVVEREDDHDTDSGDSNADKLADIRAVVDEWIKAPK